jgi:hypothetical protein
MNLVYTIRFNFFKIHFHNIYRENTAWLKQMDSISYVYISWTIHGMW